MSILSRARELIINPRVTWQIIRDEETTVKELFINYAAPLALIPALASMISMTLIGLRLPAEKVIRVSFFDSLLANGGQYLFTLTAVYAASWIITKLAPVFKSKVDRTMAAKLCIYSMTPSWLVGIFTLVPGLGLLTILGSYGIYLFFLGLPVLLETPDNKVLLYSIASLVLAFLVSLVLSMILVSTVYAPIYLKLLAVSK
ncbi:MAG: Yip1 family protein [bacterium]